MPLSSQQHWLRKLTVSAGYIVWKRYSKVLKVLCHSAVVWYRDVYGLTLSEKTVAIQAIGTCCRQGGLWEEVRHLPELLATSGSSTVRRSCRSTCRCGWAGRVSSQAPRRSVWRRPRPPSAAAGVASTAGAGWRRRRRWRENRSACRRRSRRSQTRTAPLSAPPEWSATCLSKSNERFHRVGCISSCQNWDATKRPCLAVRSLSRLAVVTTRLVKNTDWRR